MGELIWELSKTAVILGVLFYLFCIVLGAIPFFILFVFFPIVGWAVTKL